MGTLSKSRDRAIRRQFDVLQFDVSKKGYVKSGGASLAYVKEQMGHSSIQVTVDTYGHLIRGADIAWVDRLDSKTTPQQNAPPRNLSL